jgi:hypothetical protein
MNLLRNKYVVIGLALAALAMLVNSFKPMWQRGRSSSSKAPAKAQMPVAAPAPIQLASNTPAAPAAMPQAEAAQPERSIDLTKVGWNINGAPRRDPFQFINPASTNLQPLYPTATELLTLNAVWWQSGNILAEVNNRIVRDGTTISASKSGMTAEFKIQNIGLERLWVQGPNGEEQVMFDPTLSLRGIDLKLPEGTNAFAVEKRRLNWPYRVVNGITNDAYADAGWFTFSGQVLQKIDDGKYLVKDTNQAPGLVMVILINVPLDLVTDQPLTPVRCKSVGSESATAVSNAKDTRRIYDFGVPCSPPKEVVESLKFQKEFILQQYSQANERRFRIEMQEAEKGRASAQYMLGRRYLYGDGVAKDGDLARHWLKKAAAQGELDAQATLLVLGFQK